MKGLEDATPAGIEQASVSFTTPFVSYTSLLSHSHLNEDRVLPSSRSLGNRKPSGHVNGGARFERSSNGLHLGKMFPSRVRVGETLRAGRA